MNNEAVLLLRLGLNFKARTRQVWRPSFKMADFAKMGKCVDINCTIVGLWEYIPLKVWLFTNDMAVKAKASTNHLNICYLFNLLYIPITHNCSHYIFISPLL